jgi:hypothetical protein
MNQEKEEVVGYRLVFTDVNGIRGESGVQPEKRRQIKSGLLDQRKDAGVRPKVRAFGKGSDL